MNAPFHASRRQVLLGTGALFVEICAAGPAAIAEDVVAVEAGPGSLKQTPMLDSWIGIDTKGVVTVFSGKAELGQGLKTAILQIAAEQLGTDPSHIRIVTADTGRSPNEGMTAGSHSMQDSGTAVLYAAAHARALLTAAAASRLGAGLGDLAVKDGAVVAKDGRSIGFGELIGDDLLHATVPGKVALVDPAAYAVIGRPVQRVDIPAKMTGGVAYVQDLRLPGMVHARVLRLPTYAARLQSLDTSAAEGRPGVVKIVRNADFVAVVAEKEFQAIDALRHLSRGARWSEPERLPDQKDIYAYLRALPARDYVILDRQGGGSPAAKRLQASYKRPYQAHGSIGPSCAVAEFKDDRLTVWSHTQGVFPLRTALAQLTKLPEDKLRIIHTEGSGCYGHNAADDAAGDAALIACALPGRPVRVQWMREDEQASEPYGTAMSTNVAAALDADGKIVEWSYEVWSNSHNSRPGTAGSLLAGQAMAEHYPLPTPQPIPQPEGGGDRNAIPLYVLPTAKVTHHFISQTPLRVSALRGLGAYCNVFSIESFMDELAAAAGIDPVAFRLNHLADRRAREVVQIAAERFGWSKPTARSAEMRGKGFAFARYKNLGAYCAVAMEVAVGRETGLVRVLRAVAAVDSGQPVNPDGIRNQIEGGIIQSLSWSLFESVQFDETRVTSRDWSSYPILRFSAVPDTIDVHVVDRPGLPFLGTGEASQGPTGAALANAIAAATGARLRELPFTRERVKAAVGV